MYLGQVVGCVWSTVKDAHLNGQRLLLVQPLTPELKPTGRRLVATDWTGAGAGELVYYCRGKECSFPFLPAEVPTDSTIIAIVDSIHVNRQAKTEAAAEGGEASPAVPSQPPSRAPESAISQPRRRQSSRGAKC